MTKWIIAMGNMADGMTFVGPFEDYSACQDYAHALDGDWLMVTLEEPENL
jgi:hypothetical protein